MIKQQIFAASVIAKVILIPYVHVKFLPWGGEFYCVKSHILFINGKVHVIRYVIQYQLGNVGHKVPNLALIFTRRYSIQLNSESQFLTFVSRLSKTAILHNWSKNHSNRDKKKDKCVHFFKFPLLVFAPPALCVKLLCTISVRPEHAAV